LKQNLKYYDFNTIFIAINTIFIDINTILYNRYNPKTMQSRWPYHKQSGIVGRGQLLGNSGEKSVTGQYWGGDSYWGIVGEGVSYWEIIGGGQLLVNSG